MSDAPAHVTAWVSFHSAKYAECLTMPEFWVLVDKNREARERLRAKGFAAEDARMSAAAKAAYDRLQQQARAA